MTWLKVFKDRLVVVAKAATMVNPDRSPLSGLVEVDETSIEYEGKI